MNTCKSCGASDFKDGQCTFCGTKIGFTGEPIVDAYLLALKRKKMLEDEGFTIKLVKTADVYREQEHRREVERWIVQKNRKVLADAELEKLVNAELETDNFYPVMRYWLATQELPNGIVWCISGQTYEFAKALEHILTELYRQKLEKEYMKLPIKDYTKETN